MRGPAWSGSCPGPGCPWGPLAALTLTAPGALGPPLSNGTRVHTAQAPPALRPLPARRELPPRGLDCAASTTPLGFAPDPCEPKRHLPRGLLGHSPAPPTPQLALSPGHGTWQLPTDPPRLCPPPHRRSRRVGACGLPHGPQPQLDTAAMAAVVKGHSFKDKMNKPSDRERHEGSSSGTRRVGGGRAQEHCAL